MAHTYQEGGITLITFFDFLGAGTRRFKSSRPDHLKQGLSGFPLGPFLLWVTLWVTNEE